ncbi:amino acid adenylation domain-containing protein [Thermosporothrix hazakensis]|jgi:amino acid adenylation domain-containing protein|uniref:Amino acid adenylation domain-containing protein n=1 Tax=Thermosporothrix hazakensis TaxID=644383 RepID=A0A326U580_THEHA|nr:non-ribosomal peptide synthetase [Thermosporothrix hazakensis]PZW28422.1 amino acid adenylation domain-containing protein [Thermosporothrix hazakensis]GCE45202.1 hypothetical protein KTH_00710 [Thermosporothrix hazakensis]
MTQIEQEQVEGFRLSPQQRWAWTQQVSARSPFLSYCLMKLEGVLDAEQLHQALRMCVERYEILRTTFRRPPGLSLPVQVVLDTVDPLFIHRFGTAPDEQQLAALLQACDLSQHPFRAELLSVTERQHYLLLVTSALCLDAVGLATLAQEILTIYLQNSVSEEEVLQYADVSEWLNEQVESEENEVGRQYWRSCDLSGLDAATLSIANRRQEALPFCPRSYSITLDTGTRERVVTWAQQQGLSPDTFFLACWRWLLWKSSAGAEFPLGVAFHGRTYEELEQIPGLFHRYLPITIIPRADETFRELMQKTEQKLQESAEWQEAFDWERDAGTRFFPLAYEALNLSAFVGSEELTPSLEHIHACTQRFELKLQCMSTPERCTLTFWYDQHRYETAAIERMGHNFLTLVNTALMAPEAPLYTLEVVSEEEQRFLNELNTTARDYPLEFPLHRLFEQQAASCPTRMAVTYAGEALTYEQLNSRANQIAHLLRERGTTVGSLVGIYLERSLDYLACLLGILKAGAAYIPLDLSFPRERLAFLLQDTKVQQVITLAELAEQLPEAASPLCLDIDRQQIEAMKQTNPDLSIPSSALAYVLHTSGSTGQPKGVMVSHRSLVNYLHWCNEVFREFEVIPATTRLSFDASLKQLFAPLIRGGTVWLLPENIVAQPEKLFDFIRTQHHMALNTVPSLWRPFLEYARQQDVSLDGHLTGLLIGGEALESELVAKTLEVFPWLRIYNLYGPTEATANASSAVITDPTHITLGHPLANTRVYVLDDTWQRTPIGVSGELYLGGEGLALGYLDRPDLTAERFIPDPYSGDGNRLYRTGDMARILPSGELEYLGRRDHQVKLYGVRIELGEIEAVIKTYPKVHDCVVHLYQDAGGQQRLAAYIEGAEAQQGLQEWLQQRLPQAMIPSALVFLPELPRTSGGKVDRQALPTPERAESRAAYVAPQTPVEVKLAQIWGEVLHLERIGIHDNFFALGGHSLLAIQIASRVRSAFPVDVPLHLLLGTPTIAELAQQIDSLIVQKLETLSDEEAQHMLALFE